MYVKIVEKFIVLWLCVFFVCMCGLMSDGGKVICRFLEVVLLDLFFDLMYWC